MDVKTRSALCLALGILATASVASAGPVSSCSNDVGDSGFTCNIFESASDGSFSQISNVFSLPQTVSAGYIVLLDSAGSSHTDPTQWFQVLTLIDGGIGNADTAQLFSFGCNAGNSTSCFPSSSTVAGAPNAFITATPDLTQYVNGFNTFNINSVETAPEPTSSVLVAAGLILLIFSRRLRTLRNHARVAVRL